jgi:hypothetical protein
MPDGSPATEVALEYFKALRAEIIERLKMRDAILLGFLTAAGALIGYGLQHEDFRTGLLAFFPFFALGAATTVSQHQDQIVAFNQYIVQELGRHLSSGADRILDFNESEAARQHVGHNLWMNFVGQLILLCGPSIFVFSANAPFLTKGWTYKESFALLGMSLTVLTAARTWFSRRFRGRVMSRLLSSPGWRFTL